MANVPHDVQQPAIHHTGVLEYTRFHREIWPLLLREIEIGMLAPRSIKSWLRLWGRVGAILFRCFWFGDSFVRADMIALARRAGGRQGELIAKQLEHALLAMQ